VRWNCQSVIITMTNLCSKRLSWRWIESGKRAGNQSSSQPARDLVVSASASELVCREFDFRPGLTKTKWISTVAFVLGTRCSEELQETQKRTEWNETRNCTNSEVVLQDHCYKAPTTNHDLKTKSSSDNLVFSVVRSKRRF